GAARDGIAGSAGDGPRGQVERWDRRLTRVGRVEEDDPDPAAVVGPVGLAGEDRRETFLPDRRRRPAAPHIVVAEGDFVGRGEPVELGFDLAEVFLLAVLGQVPDGDGEVDRRLVELVVDGWE